jgi:hypothetical protein
MLGDHNVGIPAECMKGQRVCHSTVDRYGFTFYQKTVYKTMLTNPMSRYHNILIFCWCYGRGVTPAVTFATRVVHCVCVHSCCQDDKTAP